jgi:hypothetical protein
MAKERIPLHLNMSTMDMLHAMSEGNPGGLTVMLRMIQADPEFGLITIMHLDDMNIRGPQIWVGFKDHCKEDLPKFVQAIKDRDPAMVATINKECESYGHRATTHAASFER